MVLLGTDQRAHRKWDGVPVKRELPSAAVRGELALEGHGAGSPRLLPASGPGLLVSMWLPSSD